MSFDRYLTEETEADTEVLVGAILTQAYSPGVDLRYLDSDGRLSPQRVGAVGIVLEVENPSGGGFGAAFDAIVQTADKDAATDADWIDTDTRINGIAGPTVEDIQVTDPVLDLLRLKLVSGGGNLGFNLRTHWECDEPIQLR